MKTLLPKSDIRVEGLDQSHACFLVDSSVSMVSRSCRFPGACLEPSGSYSRCFTSSAGFPKFLLSLAVGLCILFHPLLGDASLMKVLLGSMTCSRQNVLWVKSFVAASVS